MNPATIHAIDEPVRAVLVTGAGGPSGMAAIETLRRRGYRVTAADMRCVESAADRFFQIPAVGDPGFIDALLAIIASEGVSWLFPTVSEELVIVAGEAARVRSLGAAVYIGDPGPVAICHDKWVTAQHLGNHGVAVPDSAIDAGEIEGLGYPMISKPRIGRGGRDVLVHDARPDDMAGDDRADEAGLLWQHFMPGTEYDVLLLIDPGEPGRVLVSRVFEKTALREGRTGNAVSLRQVEAPDVAELAARAARAVGLKGPADIDIRRDAKGAPRVLEINARIGAHSWRFPELFEEMIGLHLHGQLG